MPGDYRPSAPVHNRRSNENWKIEEELVRIVMIKERIKKNLRNLRKIEKELGRILKI